jgi:hypothetical protein
VSRNPAVEVREAVDVVLREEVHGAEVHRAEAALSAVVVEVVVDSVVRQVVVVAALHREVVVLQAVDVVDSRLEAAVVSRRFTIAHKSDELDYVY